MKTIFRFVFLIMLLSWQQVMYADINTSQITCSVAATQQSYPCAIGYTGIRTNKVEGDKATPAGDFQIRRIFYRADRLTPTQQEIIKGLQQRGFNVQVLTPDDIWIDDVNSPNYNQYVQRSQLQGALPSHEELWRPDNDYDIIAVIGYNDSPVEKGKGSAIFMHIAKIIPQQGNKVYKPTLGCVVLEKNDLLALLQTLQPTTVMSIPTDKPVITFK